MRTWRLNCEPPKQRAEAAHEPLAEANAEKRRLLAIGDECAHEASAVEGRREGLLPRIGDAQVDALLAKIEPHVAALRQRERDARDAAKLLQPHIDRLAREAVGTARDVHELKHRQVVGVQARHAAALREAVAALWPIVRAYVDAGEAVARSHRVTYGQPPSEHQLEPRAFKAARFVNVEAHRFFGPGGALALDTIFPPEAGRL